MQYVAETLLADRLPAAPASSILATNGQVESQRSSAKKPRSFCTGVSVSEPR
jgi:hypothetical protein